MKLACFAKHCIWRNWWKRIWTHRNKRKYKILSPWKQTFRFYWVCAGTFIESVFELPVNINFSVDCLSANDDCMYYNTLYEKHTVYKLKITCISVFNEQCLCFSVLSICTTISCDTTHVTFCVHHPWNVVWVGGLYSPVKLLVFWYLLCVCVFFVTDSLKIGTFKIQILYNDTPSNRMKEE